MLVNRLWRRMDKVEAEKRCDMAKELVVLLYAFTPLNSIRGAIIYC